jgi:DNA-binding transcriptional LysR family regulator
MDNIQHLQAFLRTVEKGSFSAVARDQGISQSAVSKQIAALEGVLGMQLFRRTTRKLSPTPEAMQLYPHVRQLLDAVDVVRSETHGVPATGVAGTLRITMLDIRGLCLTSSSQTARSISWKKAWN